MILHDRVSALLRVQTGTDRYGQPIYGTTEVSYRAEVRPLSSTENVIAGQQVSTRFRVFLGPQAHALTATDALRWRGNRYEVDGDVEPHTVNGRVHHYEAVIKRVSG